MNNMQIFIPTFMREDKQKCFNNLPPEIQSMVTLVTHSGRAELLAEKNPNAKVMDLGSTDGIADVRQKLLSAATSNKVMIIDDSCVFKVRNDELKLRDMSVDDYKNMFAMVEKELDNFGMVGISDQAGNNRVTEDLKQIGRSYSCYGVNKETWASKGVSFDGMYKKNPEIKLYEDFYAILKMLTSGLPNAIIYKYAFSHAHGKPGGNSTVRTNALQKRCIEALQEEFPGLVKMVKKEDPSWSAGLTDVENFRWECQISWQEAFKRSENTGSLDDFFA
jgi:hypothetical protein